MVQYRGASSSICKLTFSEYFQQESVSDHHRQQTSEDFFLESKLSSEKNDQQDTQEVTYAKDTQAEAYTKDTQADTCTKYMQADSYTIDTKLYELTVPGKPSVRFRSQERNRKYGVCYISENQPLLSIETICT